MRLDKSIVPLLGLLISAAIALSACGPAAPSVSQLLPVTPVSAEVQATPDAQPATATPRPANYLDQLIAAAKAEGQLTVIGLPRGWCNYGSAISEFESKYGIQVNELEPTASSEQQLQAIVANKDTSGPQAPDVIDVSLGFGPQAVQQALIQPYQVSAWKDIPTAAKDANGYWYGDYYGVISFEVNTDVVKSVPQDWTDLLQPQYKNQVALSADPRNTAQAAQAVFAAGLSADGGNTDNAAKAGMDFFDKLNMVGNFVPVIGDIDAVAKGTTPINLTWDYLSLAEADALAGHPHIRTVVPRTGVVAELHVQAISAYAPHPNAAKLWEEFLYSDEGQLQFLKAYCHPILFSALSAANKIPADLAAKLPPGSSYADVFFPTLEAQAAAVTQIGREWDTIVGADVK